MTVKVTITATLEPEKDTVNFYGVHNLNRELVKLLQESQLTYLTLHVFSKEEALRAAEFCAKNSLEYKIGGSR